MIDVETLRSLLRYNAHTGALTWRRRDRKWFPSDVAWKIWNSQNAGQLALTCRHGSGYLCGGIFGKMYLAHRVCWALHYGEWPTHQVDHADHVRTNNKIRNLEAVTNRTNSKNLPLRNSNRSGHHGVYWRRVVRSKCPWIASITIDGRTTYLGVFRTRTAAVSARKSAEKKLGYHKNHGAKRARF